MKQIIYNALKIIRANQSRRCCGDACRSTTTTLGHRGYWFVNWAEVYDFTLPFVIKLPTFGCLLYGFSFCCWFFLYTCFSCEQENTVMVYYVFEGNRLVHRWVQRRGNKMSDLQQFRDNSDSSNHATVRASSPATAHIGRPHLLWRAGLGHGP